MKPIEDNSLYKFILGDCLSILKKMDSNSISCIITSPPYWGMRKYDNNEDEREIGNEDYFKDYVNILTNIFTEAKRVLTPDGSFWLNLGDKYENKHLLGMPWRVALSLIDNAGWILRNDVIWDQLKGTQSCKDRLRDSYEHFFHFVKNKTYYYDGDSIRIKPKKEAYISNGKITSSTGVSGVKYRKIIENSTVLSDEEKENALNALNKTLDEIKTGIIHDFRMTIRGAQRAWHSDNTDISGRAKELEKRGYYIMKMQCKGNLPSDIWRIVTEDTWRKDNHCAVFPIELLTIPIIATCPKNGIVLDPFSGTGTTVVAALNLGRRGVGIELSEEYINVSKKRINSIELCL
ncbi:MAG: site-specific DNA-methyltransferase [Prevotella sp.]|nr:site-specific DNA-methyltransferase [Prevotella sp.]